MPKRIMKEFRIDEISAVDRPAQQGARMVIMKRDGTTDADDIAKYVSPMIDGAMKPGAQTFDEIYRRGEEQRRQWEANEELWPLFSALEDSLRSIAADSALNAGAKVSKIEESVAAFMAAIKAELPDIESELSKVLKEHIASVRKAAGLAGDDTGNPNMPTEAEKFAALEKSVAELTTKNTELTDHLAAAVAKQAEAETIAKFSPDEATYFAKSDDKGKKDFLAAKPEDRAKKAADAKANDETFKMSDGTEIRKSEIGAAAYSVLKSQEQRITAQAEALKKAEEANADSGFTKRAETEMAHLPGTPVEKAAVLKGIAALPEAAQKTFTTIISAAEKMSKAGFATLGSGAGNAPVEGSAKAEVAAKVAEVKKSDAKLSEDQVLAKVYEANPELADRVAAEERSAAN